MLASRASTTSTSSSSSASILLMQSLMVVVAIAMGRIFQLNPMLYGGSAGPLLPDDPFRIYTSHPVLTLLDGYKTQLGVDYTPYRNHCLRTLSFAVYFAQQDSSATIPDSKVDLMALALVYHDLALWSRGTLDYLEPSVKEMLSDTEKQKESAQKKGGEEELNEEERELQTQNEVEQMPKFISSTADLDTAREIIIQHHKFTTWIQPKGSLADAILVNAIRKADWADFTIGLIRYGLPYRFLEAALTTLPEAGFHVALAKLGPRLSPNSLVGQLDILNIFKW